MINKVTLARFSKQPVDEIISFIALEFALSLPEEGYTITDCPETIKTCDAKKLFTEKRVGFESKYGCNKYDVAKNMVSAEVCDDIKTFINTLIRHFPR